LGNIALAQISESCKTKSESCKIKKDIDILALLEKYENTFLYACLLHDIGHAPFSHTGELFYNEEKDDNNIPKINKELVDLVSCDGFKLDAGHDARRIESGNIYTYEFNPSAPHEIMSAIVGIELIQEKTFNFDKDLFARLITGIAYGSPLDPEKSVKNCLISLLHSSNIDVDRLDYTMRDTYMAGFLSTAIDYERLFKGLTIAPSEEGDHHYELAYHKNSLSALDSVIVALDFERKWIQDHPV
jgi:HD superfamily phosphohydrolase